MLRHAGGFAPAARALRLVFPQNGCASQPGMLGGGRLRAWLREQGIWWDANLVAVQARMLGCGFGVWAIHDVNEGALLCRIPKAAILSRRTTCIADILEQERIAGGLGLTIACASEATSPDSPWYAGPVAEH